MSEDLPVLNADPSAPPIMNAEANEFALRQEPWRETLGWLYDSQVKLNRFSEFDVEDNTMHTRLVYAFDSEVHEVMDELKPIWAWWSRKEVNHAALREEVTDLWFFFMSFVQLINSEMMKHTERDDFMNEFLFDNLLSMLFDQTDPMGQLVHTAVTLGEADRWDEDHTNFLIASLDHLKLATARELNIIYKVINDGDRNVEDGTTTRDVMIHLSDMFLGLVSLSEAVGLNVPALRASYTGKSLVNIARWESSGLITEDMAGEAEELKLSLTAGSPG